MESTYGRMYRDLHERHWWWRAREAHVLRWLRGLMRGPTRGGGARILDVGCGDGLMWDRLEELGHVEGIEPDARLVNPGSRRRQRIEIASFPAGRPRETRYDVVLLLDVLEHIEDEQAALGRVASLLDAGGHLLLTVPALPLLWSEFDELNGHQRRYTRGTLHAAVEAAGLEIVRLRYYYVWTVLPLLARRMLFRSARAGESRFLRIPPAPVNRLLYRLSVAEHLLGGVLPPPVGSSIIALARRPAAGAGSARGDRSEGAAA